MAGIPKERLRKTALAARLGINRGTIRQYLGMVGAPAPNASGTYAVEEMIKFMAEHTSIGAVGDEDDAEAGHSLQYYKREEVKLRCQKMQDDIDRARGKFISHEEASRTIVAIIQEFADALNREFVMKNPSVYKGKDMVEWEEINRKSVYDVILRLKQGAKPLIIGG